MSARPHLLLGNLGTPQAPTPEAVREFLTDFLSDPAVVDLPRLIWQPILKYMVLRSRPQRVAEAYESVWSPEGSPLRVATERMVQAVRDRADGALSVSSAYRYGEPSPTASVSGRSRPDERTSSSMQIRPRTRTDPRPTGTGFRPAIRNTRCG